MIHQSAECRHRARGLAGKPSLAVVLVSYRSHHHRSYGQTFADAYSVSSFAVPFEEDDKDPKTWFLDLDYIESMWEMFRKVNGESRRDT